MSPLPGAHFALYREVTAGAVTRIDYSPIIGYDDLVSQEMTGIIPAINQSLQPGVYYLVETVQPHGYRKALQPIRFTLSRTGTVHIDSSQSAELEEVLEDSTRRYTLYVKNAKQEAPVPTGIVVRWLPYAMASMLAFIVYVLIVMTKLARKRL